MSEGPVVRYPPRAAPALGYLKQYYNDIEIYIEDTTCHSMPLFLFRAILGSGVKLTSLNQLGGRKAVLDACRLDQAADGRKKIYIIDGDLDLITQKRRPNLRHLYRLRSYCIENLIISETAVAELILECQPDLTPSQAASVVDFNKWASDARTDLLPLFVYYGVCRILAPGVVTVGLSINQLYLSAGGTATISKMKVQSRIRLLLRQVAASANISEVSKIRKRLQTAAVGYQPSGDYLISGKDYLFPLLKVQLGRLMKFYGNESELKARMARYYDPRREPYLAKRLRAVAAV